MDVRATAGRLTTTAGRLTTGDSCMGCIITGRITTGDGIPVGADARRRGSSVLAASLGTPSREFGSVAVRARDIVLWAGVRVLSGIGERCEDAGGTRVFVRS